MAKTERKSEQAKVSVEELARAIAGAMPKLDPTEQRIAITTYRLLAAGKPVAIEAIGSEVGVTAARVQDALNSWPGVYRNEAGEVAGFWGLATSPLDPEYRLQAEDKTSYAWCALDTLFIPPLLGKQVSVQATDPVTGQDIALEVGSDGVQKVAPAGAVVSMVIPDGAFDYDVIDSFCHKVLFFASEESGRKWVAEHEGTTLLTVEEAFAVGSFAPKYTYPDVFRAKK